MKRSGAVWGMKGKLLSASLVSVILSVGVMYVGVRYRVAREMGRLEEELLDKTVQHVTASLYSQADKRDKDLKILSEQQSAQKRILAEQQSAQQKVLAERQAVQQRMIERLLQDKAESVAALLAKIAAEPLLVSDTMKIDDMVRSCRADRQVAYLLVADKAGKVLNALTEATNIPKVEWGRYGLRAGDPAGSLKGLTASGSLFHVRKAIAEEGATLGTVYAGVFRTLALKQAPAASPAAEGEASTASDAAGGSSGAAGPAAPGGASASLGLDAPLARELANVTNAEVAFFGNQGLIAASSDAAAGGLDLEKARQAAGQPAGVRERTSAGGHSFLVSYKPLEGAFQGVVLRVALPTDATASANRGIGIMLLVSGGLALGVALVVSLWTVLRTARPLTALTAVTRRIAAGDLTCTVGTVRSRDEIGVLAEGVGQLAENLKGILTRVKSLASDLSEAAGTTAGASDRMQQGAEVQRGQMAEVSGSSAQVTESLNEVARTAAGTLEASHHALKAAEEGKQTVDHSVAVMLQVSAAVDQTASAVEKLGLRSQEIGSILQVINDIADQINLLSLNAAIEAARAGEHGRGFAVVADEVRKLAEKATSATKGIEATIKGIQEETGGAVDVMHHAIEQAGRAMDASKEADVSLQRIVESSRSAVDMINNIAAATEEQSVIVQTIAQHIEQVAGVAGNVYVEATEVRSAAASLTDVAASLSSELERFTI